MKSACVLLNIEKNHSSMDLLCNLLIWVYPFEIMCDANKYAVGVVLGQKKDKKMNAIYYSSRKLDVAQINYATKEK